MQKLISYSYAYLLYNISRNDIFVLHFCTHFPIFIFHYSPFTILLHIYIYYMHTDAGYPCVYQSLQLMTKLLCKTANKPQSSYNCIYTAPLMLCSSVSSLSPSMFCSPRMQHLLIVRARTFVCVHLNRSSFVLGAVSC